MAMLDKEVAEERAEIAEAELEEVKEKLAVVEVEMGVMKDGGGKIQQYTQGGAYLTKSQMYLVTQEPKRQQAKIHLPTSNWRNTTSG